MINDDIIVIKDSILDTVGETCEKIILFGSHAYGTPHKDSDYDFFVVLKDNSEKPILVLQKIYRNLARRPMLTPVDVLANYKSRFEWRSTQPTIERKIANDGVILYERQMVYNFCTGKVPDANYKNKPKETRSRPG
jgi:predicted nucleotidyltransferase